MLRRWLVLVLVCLFPLQSVYAACHDYSDHATHGKGAEQLLFHTHDAGGDHDEHGDLDSACKGESQHDGKTGGHSHAPHVPLLLTLTIDVAPAFHPRPPSSRPPIYLSAILEQLDRPPLPARR